MQPVTHASCIAAGVGIGLSRVCLFVSALKGKRLELLTPNSVHVYSIVVAGHVFTQRSKGQGHTVTKTVTVASDACCCRRRGSACRYDCLFSSLRRIYNELTMFAYY